MTNEEAIYTLRGLFIPCASDGNKWGCDRNEALEMAIEALSAEAEWIPCSERLPDNKTYVLTTIQVSGRQPHARSGFYHDGFFHNDNGDTWRATEREVKAWMPLPKPYREDGDTE